MAVGRAVRFVPSPDPAFRCYDLDVRRVVVGERGRSISFMAAPEELPGIRQGDAVLIIGRNVANPDEIAAGACTPLVRLPDADPRRIGVEP